MAHIDVFIFELKITIFMSLYMLLYCLLLFLINLREIEKRAIKIFEREKLSQININ